MMLITPADYGRMKAEGERKKRQKQLKMRIQAQHNLFLIEQELKSNPPSRKTRLESVHFPEISDILPVQLP